MNANLGVLAGNPRQFHEVVNRKFLALSVDSLRTKTCPSCTLSATSDKLAGGVRDGCAVLSCIVQSERPSGQQLMLLN